ncbi:type 2 isopentenyl-diphosphate Delta-isomerase [Candidatus Bathyarchaeota archaeon RBG_13_60_20]|nr:MAG: type 2 isopentenyl-diphosphate Delta-isomerase [Candidatus Bathyarchaeota archaeon RBG_13_60_20]
MSGIEARKLRHIRVSLEEDVEADTGTGLQDVRLIHRALPEIDLDDVSTEATLFGKRLSAPLIISAITGGTAEAKRINEVLASVAEEKGIGIGVGSQRIAVAQPETTHTFTVVRERAPTTFVMGNMGCPQLSLGWGPHEAQACVDMVDADALAIHMNPLQEAVQVGGDTNYRGILGKVKEVASALSVPVVMKETGCGVSHEDARRMEAAGARGLEVSGLGGTSWSAVEHQIAREVGERRQEYLGQALWNWGIPTAVSVVETSRKTGLTIIASGGLRTGADVAKSIALGASAAGMAKPFLEKAVEGPEALGEHVDNLVQELRVVMFLVGAKSVAELRRAPALIMGRTAEWLSLRGFSVEEYAAR